MATSRDRATATRIVWVSATMLTMGIANPTLAQQQAGDNDGGLSRAIEGLLRAIGNSSTDLDEHGQSQPAQTDPTVPSDKVLSRLPASPEPQTGQRNRSPLRSLPMPTIPKVTIRGIVLSSASKGTAMLNVGGETVSIDLIPLRQQDRVPIPPEQFAELRPAIEQRMRAVTEQAGDTRPLPTYEMCLRCSFVAEGVVFNVEDFSTDSLLLRALPHDSLVLVRR